MTEYGFGQDIVKLADLLKPPPEEEYEQQNYPTESSYGNPYKLKEVKDVNNTEPKTTEEFETEQEKEFDQAHRETRKEAEYNIKYRQAVTPEDVFLQMSGKTPATASCEDMIVTIKLPGEKFSGLELEVKNQDVKLSGCSYKLDLSLPSPINPDLSKANWDQSSESLILTLRMDREFDFVNF